MGDPRIRYPFLPMGYGIELDGKRIGSIVRRMKHSSDGSRLFRTWVATVNEPGRFITIRRDNLAECKQAIRKHVLTPIPKEG